MKHIIITYFKIRNAYRYFRKNWNPERIWGCYIVLIAIPGALVIDIWWHSHDEPLKYVAETAHAEEVAPKVDHVIFEVDYSHMTEERVMELVDEAAQKYHVSADRMKATMRCENPELDPYLQSHIVQKGVREDSWGLAQIWLPAHPEISKKDAQNPYFAIDFMAKEFSEGRAWKWTCYRSLYGK